MKLFTWTIGRQAECEYKKFCFLWTKFWRIGMDGYILKYEPHTVLPLHKDLVKGGKHYRLNIVLKRKSDFNYVERWSTIINLFDSRIVLFRPDLWLHGVRNCDGVRIVLSIGFLWIDKKK